MKNQSHKPFVPSWKFFAVIMLVFVLLGTSCAPLTRRPGSSYFEAAEGAVRQDEWLLPDQVPLRVIPHHIGAGQLSGYVASTGVASVLFQTSGLTVAVPYPESFATAMGETVPLRSIQVVYHGSAAASAPLAMDRLPETVNLYVGADPAAWREGVPVYGQVHYQRLYPGIDLVYTGMNGWNSGSLQLKGTFSVAPGGDPARIRWSYPGSDQVELQEDGSLRIELQRSQSQHDPFHLIEQAPVAWQEVGGEPVEIPVRFRLNTDGVVGFELGSYDPAHPLIIDPVLEYSTFLGGEGIDEGLDVAVDGARSAVVVGTTLSVNFPSDVPLQEELTGSRNIFITKLSRDGLDIDFSNLLGGSGDDIAQSVVVDSAGDIYLAGYTVSPDFPATALTAIPEGGSGEDGFLVKFSLSGGTIRYSSVVGGTDDDRFLALDVDSGGNTYLAGTSASDDFPLAEPLQGRYGGGETDAVFLKMSAVGNEILLSSYLGGTASEEAYGVAVDRDGSPYITGFTTSIDFPTEAPLQEELGGLQDAFLTKVTDDYSAFAYSTYLGVGIGSVGHSVVVDREGHAYLVGTMERTEEEGRGGSDVFVLRLGENGDTLDINQVIGGRGDDEGYDIDLDRDQNIYIVGFTESDDLESANSFQSGYGGEGDGFLTQLNPAGELVTTNYIGGSQFDAVHGITVFGSGDAVIAGVTFSDDFPTFDPLQRNNRGGGDAFVMKVGEVEFIPTPAPTNTPEPTPLPPTPTPEPTVFVSIVESNLFLYGIFGLIGLVVLLLIVEIIRNARRRR